MYELPSKRRGFLVTGLSSITRNREMEMGGGCNGEGGGGVLLLQVGGVLVTCERACPLCDDVDDDDDDCATL